MSIPPRDVTLLDEDWADGVFRPVPAYMLSQLMARGVNVTKSLTDEAEVIESVTYNALDKRVVIVTDMSIRTYYNDGNVLVAMRSGGPVSWATAQS